MPTEYAGETVAGDYTISSAETLRLLAEKSASTPFAGSTFTLTADIDLADAEWTPISTFSGTFDGDGHTISNLVVNLPTTEDVGFFKILKNATIKKLSIRGGKVEGLNRAAGIAGRVSGGTVFEDCTTDLEVIAHGYDAGGLVAWVDGTGNNCFTRCRTLGPVTAYADVDRAGGLVAVTDSSFTIDSCYASGAVTGYGTTGHVGGLLGRRNGGTVTVKNSYSVSRLQGNYMTQATESTDDDIVGTGLTSVTVESRPTILDCFPKKKINLAKRGNGSGTVAWVDSKPVATADEGSVFIRWDGEMPTEENYNERTLYAVFGKAIATEDDLRAVTAKGFFKQTGDIEMTSGASFNGLHASPRFQGEYDGAGYAIKNLKVTAAGENTGLFRVTQGAILRNIHLVGGEVSGGKHVGALVGWQFGGLVERCSASTVVRATAIHAAGLIGRASYHATIRECCASGPVISTSNYVGGLVSFTSNTAFIEDCFARGDVRGTDNVGGFIGGADDALTIKNCYSTGKVNCSVSSGGFFARDDGGKTVTGCVWDSAKAGQTRSTYGTGKPTAEMFGSSVYTNWDANTWNFPENGYPTLKRMSTFSLTPIVSGCGTGTAEAVDNSDGTRTFTAVPAEGSWFVRWSGLATAEATEPSLTIACDGTETPVAIFGTIITSLDQFKTIWSNPDTSGAYRLDTDLDFANKGVRMTQIFEGIFDGNGHTISNFVLNLPSTDDVGLFTSLRGATVKNLAIRGGRIEGRNRVGGIATYVRGSTVIENCTTDLEVVANGYEAGGIVGFIDGAGNNRLTRCCALGPATAYDGMDRAGGLIAKCDSSITIDSCYTSGAITGYGTTGHVGGLIGLRGNGTVTVKNSYSVSRLQGNYITQETESTDDDIVGTGLASVTVESRPTILDCFPNKKRINLAKRGNGSGTVAWVDSKPMATEDEGSVFIRWDGEMPTEENYNERTLYAVFGKTVASEADLRAVTAKGFFKQTADIEMSSSDRFYGLHESPRFQGEYDGQGFAIKNLNIASGDNGGLFRVTQGAILKDIHLVGGKVSGGKHVGALIGAQNGGLTERCSASTVVRATAIHAGGLIGRADYNATIRECCALGPVDSTADYVGGLISYTSYTALIENCYARGDVKGTENVGGFIGGANNALTIKNCYSSGCVGGAANTGGFFARNDGGKTVTDCFWDSTKAGQTRSTYGTGKPTAEMFGESAYTGWDAAIWDFAASGYPTLKAMSNLTPTPIVSGCGTGTVSATRNADGTWTFTATPAEGSWFVRWSGLITGEATTPSITIACDGSDAPVAIFGTSIKTVDELKAVWSDPDILGYYRLEADLDFANTGVRMTKDFGGLFDGNGHTISNLVLKLPSTDDVGLFAFLRNATVKNLAIRGGYIEGCNRVGGLVGRVKGGTVIENCTTDLEVVANGFEGGGFVGVIDSTGSCRLTRCRALGPVTGYYYDERVGGLIGRSDYAITIDSCYASGAVTGYGTTGYVGGLIGWRTGGTATIRNSYSISRLQGNYRTQATESTEDDIVGNWGDGGVTVVSTATIIDDVPKGIHLATRGNGSGTVAWDEATGKPVATADEGSVFIRWDGEMPTEENYNERTLYAVFGKAVATEADLRAVTAKGFYKQIDDIEMTSNMAPGLHNSPRFQGEYDGDGYAIKNLALEGGSNDNVALFRATQGAVLRNIILDGGKVAGRHQVAPLVGWMYGGLVERCSANMEVAGTGNHAAGLVGRSAGRATVRQSRALGSVTGSQYVGGLISYMEGVAYTYDCYSRCSVTANANAGGFIGATSDDNSVVHNCFVVGPVTGTGAGVGGFWGKHENGSKVRDLVWDQEVSGQTSSYRGSAKTTAEMKEMKLYETWDDTVWRKVEGEYLELWAFSGQADAPRFTVTWVNYDGTVLAQKAVREGVVPRYPGAMPIKPAANGKFYNFTGWSPEPTAVTGDVTYTARFQAAKNRNWMIVDLVTGAISYEGYDFTTATNVFNTLEYKTKKMVFRRVAAGDNYYVKDGECTAQMASSYYIGLFEVTSAQYALMQSGSLPSSYTVADYKAKGSLNRFAVRGSTDSPETFGAGITATSPLGRFNARVRTANGNAALTFDLPTEAMWEVAARAADSGDTTRKTWKWYFGEDETLLSQHAFIANDSSADDYGITSGLRVPGSRLANGWGIFDMYGNARELCLDGADGRETPQYEQGQWTQAPACKNDNQRTRGGAYDDDPTRGRSSRRDYHDTGAYGHCGIRLARLCSADEEMVPEEEVTIPAETTGGTEVTIPMTWFETFSAFAEKFGDDFAAAAVKPTGKTTANGSPMYVWHDFVAGTDPTDETDVFKAIIEIVDGEVRISWEPNLNTEDTTVRLYRKWGKANLSDEEWLPANSGHNFFKVTVEISNGTTASDTPGAVATEGAE